MTITAPDKKFLVSWETLHRDAKALAWKLHKMRPWKGVVAVTRGGLAPAAIVARELDIRVIETVGVIGYRQGDGATSDRAEAHIVKRPADTGDGAGWLIVDDLVDTGRTADILRRLMPQAHFAAVYAKPMGKPLIDTFITEVSQDTWIYLPWDIELQFAQPIATRPG